MLLRRDVNSVVLTGTVVSSPTLLSMKNNRKMLLFTFRVSEHFVRADGEPATHENHVAVEALGKSAERYHQLLRKGDRYKLSGYLRVDEIDGIERTRVRCFQIEEFS